MWGGLRLSLFFKGKSMIVYKIGGPNVACKGLTYAFKGVSEEEGKELLANGWFAELQEAIEDHNKPAPKPKTKPKAKAKPKKTSEVAEALEILDKAVEE